MKALLPNQKIDIRPCRDIAWRGMAQDDRLLLVKGVIEVQGERAQIYLPPDDCDKFDEIRCERIAPMIDRAMKDVAGHDITSIKLIFNSQETVH